MRTALILILLSARPVWADTLLIDTKFDHLDASNQLTAGDAPRTESALPLTAPTAIRLWPSATENAASIRALKPGAELHDGWRPGTTNASAPASVWWDLSALHLSKGRNELTFDTAARQTDKQGGRFQIRFNTAVTDPPQAPIDQPGNVAAQWPLINLFHRADGKGYQKDVPQSYRIVFDLDRRVSSVEVDGKPLQPETAFPDFLNTGATGQDFLRLIVFGSEAGYGDQPDSTWTIANVKLRRLESK